MASRELRIGPFVKGLNTYSDPTSIQDEEVTELVNLELDLDGSLKSRPAIVDNGTDMDLGNVGSSKNMHLLGWFYDQGNEAYLIATDGDSKTYYLNAGSWKLITSDFAATDFAQFDGYAWLLAPDGSNKDSGKWNLSTSFTGVKNMPKGDSIVEWNFRLWVVKGKNAQSHPTRMYFSNILSESIFWPSPSAKNYIDVGAGDGQTNVCLKVYSNILLIFRTQSTYGFEYRSDPKSGSVRAVLDSVGLDSRHSIEQYRNYLYFIYESQAYEFINNRVNRLNVKVPFEAPGKVNTYLNSSVSVFNDRVMFSFFDRLFVFDLRTRAWTTWASSTWKMIGKVFQIPNNSNINQVPSAYTHINAGIKKNGKKDGSLLYIEDSDFSDNKEEMTCSVKTKNLDYGVSAQYKRLFWWGMDVSLISSMKTIMSPITLGGNVGWGNLISQGITWGNMESWKNPVSGAAQIVETYSPEFKTIGRKFIRASSFSTRFRQINFKVEFYIDGTNQTSPVKLFDLVTYVVAKEHVSKKVT